MVKTQSYDSDGCTRYCAIKVKFDLLLLAFHHTINKFEIQFQNL